jgi:hypothetical protein
VLVTSCLVATASIAAHADIVEVSVTPSSWKLENYIGDSVVLWGTPSPCPPGQLILPGTATADDKKRLWAVVLAAKVAEQPVFVRYDTLTCVIQSFGMP